MMYRQAPKLCPACEAPLQPMLGTSIAIANWVVSEGKTFFGRRFVRAQVLEPSTDEWRFDSKHGMRTTNRPTNLRGAPDLPKEVRDAMLHLYHGYGGR